MTATPGPVEPQAQRRRAERLTEAVRRLLVAKGVLTEADIARAVGVLTGRSPALGARVVARAWTDVAFAARLRQDARGACRELGIELGPIEVAVVENTPEVHNLVVCTLCSCYPRSLLGIPPDWYKDAAYRSRAVSEPRTVLAEFGTVLAEQVEVRVHDSTADLRYLVVPLRPEGTGHLDEVDLAALVSRDAMIGVSVVTRPVA
ncbi:nitrile hydratase subunit alpha [Geodermatophilus sp. DSM 44513]|uniref:nitrile hydratase subunit alpha n=1 Tax=Geodermatophilus sp. DSM 44513 TaxID=1528104 RepID=UPI00127DC34F|nr:nitrile hydratase subunit alpha [Geodermatophilus sp. DSM 44513]WNV77102.1 nitrile hydratase subunit alpha [Geodermatophilus sp. DSM 44513]